MARLIESELNIHGKIAKEQQPLSLGEIFGDFNKIWAEWEVAPTFDQQEAVRELVKESLTVAKGNIVDLQRPDLRREQRWLTINSSATKTGFIPVKDIAKKVKLTEGAIERRLRVILGPRPQSYLPAIVYENKKTEVVAPPCIAARILYETKRKKLDKDFLPADNGSISVKVGKIIKNENLQLEENGEIFWVNQTEEVKQKLWGIVLKGRSAEQKATEGCADAIESMEWGRAAEEIVVSANDGLVYNLVHIFADTRNPYFEDLMQIGRIGLLNAVRRFRSLGYSLSTYAVRSIRWELRNSDVLDWFGIPVNLRIKIAKFFKAEEELSKQLKRQPRREEVFDYLGLEEKEINRLKTAQSRTVVHIETVIRSEEDGFDENWDEHFLVKSPEEELFEKDSLTTALLWTEFWDVVEGLTELNETEVKVLELYYGKDGRQRFEEEIAKELGYTRQRIQQIKAGALKKIKEEFIKRGLGIEFF